MIKVGSDYLNKCNRRESFDFSSLLNPSSLAFPIRTNIDYAHGHLLYLFSMHVHLSLFSPSSSSSLFYTWISAFLDICMGSSKSNRSSSFSEKTGTDRQTESIVARLLSSRRAMIFDWWSSSIFSIDWVACHCYAADQRTSSVIDDRRRADLSLDLCINDRSECHWSFQRLVEKNMQWRRFYSTKNGSWRSNKKVYWTMIIVSFHWLWLEGDSIVIFSLIDVSTDPLSMVKFAQPHSEESALSRKSTESTIKERCEDRESQWMHRIWISVLSSFLISCGDDSNYFIKTFFPNNVFRFN